MINFKLTIILVLSSICLLMSDALRWIVQSDLSETVRGNLTDKSNREELLAQLARKNVTELATHLWAELLSMGMGNDFYGLSCTANDTINHEHHTIAATVMRLSRKLHIMHAVFDAMAKGATKGAEYVNRTGDVTKAMAVVYDEIERLLKNDTTLYAEYVTAKNETSNAGATEHEVYYPLMPATETEAKKIFARWLNHPSMKSISANGFFEGQARLDLAASPDTFLLVTAILGLAYDERKRTAVQTIYENALFETARSLRDMRPDDVDNDRQGDLFLKSTIYPLLENLQTKFEADANLNADLKAFQEKLITFFAENVN